MFCWRQWSIFFLGSWSEDVHVLSLFSLCLDLGGEECAPYNPMRFRPFHWSSSGVVFDSLLLWLAVIFFYLFGMGYKYKISQQLISTIVERVWARMGYFLHHLDPDIRKMIRKLERLHLKILKRKLSLHLRQNMLKWYIYIYIYLKIK